MYFQYATEQTYVNENTSVLPTITRYVIQDDENSNLAGFYFISRINKIRVTSDR